MKHLQLLSSGISIVAREAQTTKGRRTTVALLGTFSEINISDPRRKWIPSNNPEKNDHMILALESRKAMTNFLAEQDKPYGLEPWPRLFTE